MKINLIVTIRYTLICLSLIMSTFFQGAAFSSERKFPAGSQDVTIRKTVGMRTDLLQNIAPIVEKSIAQGNYPGAVILISHRGNITYKGVFGSRRIVPDIAPMRFDTIFDIASLTKVVATTPAIMQLMEEGKIDLDAKVAKYWPDFAAHGKGSITIRELLTHTSGLPAALPFEPSKLSKQELKIQLINLSLKKPAGKSFSYSDVNFLVLAQIVELIAKEPIDQYASNHIFKPLKMNNTFYSPSEKIRDNIAPTEVSKQSIRWGKVQDPIASALGGVAGNAGLFSNANDLGIYVQSLLNGGVLPEKYVDGDKTLTHFLGPLSIEKMTTVQTPDTMSEARGLGWDIDSPYSNRGVLFPIHSYGHTGWTGTSLWVDPVSQTWIVILTSRAHPAPARDNQLVQDRKAIANIVSASIVDVPTYGFNNTGAGELTRAYAVKS